MRKEEGNPMTAVTFAEAMGVDYTTVMRWLRNKLVPGAEQIEPIPGMKIWQIPMSALQMERPKSGPKKEPSAADSELSAADAAAPARPAKKTAGKKASKK
jgi:hypothetical protein